MASRVALAHGIGGGMERQSHALAVGLAGRGHEVTLVTTSHPEGVLSEEVDGVRIFYLRGSTWRRYERRWWRDSWALLRRQHRSRPYDVVISQSAGALGYLAPAGTELGIPGVVILYGSARGDLVAGWRGARTPRGLYRLFRLGWRLPPLVVRWRRASPSVHTWVAVSPEVAAASRGEVGVPASRFTVVPAAVDTALFRPEPAAGARFREGLGISPSAPLICLVTRLEIGKGVQVALDAVRRLVPAHPDLLVVVAGDGHEAANLRRRARRLGLGQSVRFLGQVSNDEVPGVLAAADAFVMPSLIPEGMPVSVVEAMAVGLPVVASDTGGTASAVSHGSTGLLVPPGDAVALAGAVGTLLDDASTRRSMGRQARRVAGERFSIPAMLDAFEAVISSSIGERTGEPYPR